VTGGAPVRAAVLRTQGQPLTIEELLLAPPGPGEVEVRIAACGICHSDISYLTGAWQTRVPAVVGHEGAGFVATVGDGVSGVLPGQRVLVTLVRACGSCFFCEREQPALCETIFPLDKASPSCTDSVPARSPSGLSCTKSQVVPIPDDLPFDCASLLACGVGAVANTAGVGPGASVVVIGAGGVGLNSIQAAALARAEPVIAVDLDESRLARGYAG